jgi:hypothetical protein
MKNPISFKDEWGSRGATLFARIAFDPDAALRYGRTLLIRAPIPSP